MASHNLLEWARRFIENVKDLTADGRKLLLTYDGYRSHMTIPVLELFKSSNIIVYCLPAHTSGKLQPLDLVVFGSFKNAMRRITDETVQPLEAHRLTMYDFCTIMRSAYHYSFARTNRVGLWPFSPQRVLNTTLPRDTNDTSTLIAADALMNLFEQKRAAVHEQVFGSTIEVLDCGFVNTSRGAVLTSDAALSSARRKCNSISQKRRNDALLTSRIELAAIRREEKLRLKIARLKEASVLNRAKLAKVSNGVFISNCRSLKERHAIARTPTHLRREMATGLIEGSTD